MSKYMKGHFYFFGIKSPLRQKIMREWWRGQSIKNEYDLKCLISSLWKLDEREFQYVALDFGKRFKILFTLESIPFIRACVTTKSWWDTVDTVASHFTGAVVYQYPKTGKVMDKWIDDKICGFAELPFYTSLISRKEQMGIGCSVIVKNGCTNQNFLSEKLLAGLCDNIHM